MTVDAVLEVFLVADEGLEILEVEANVPTP